MQKGVDNGMKRLIALFLCAVMLTSLCACGQEQTSAPDGMAEETYTLGAAVLEIAEDYLAGNYSAQEAAEQIKPYCASFDTVETADSSEEMYNALVQLSAEALVYNLTAIADGTYTDDDQVESDCEVLSDYLAGIQE